MCFGNIIKTLCSKFKIILRNLNLGKNQFSKNHPMLNVWGPENITLDSKLNFFYMWLIIQKTHYGQFKTIQKSFMGAFLVFLIKIWKIKKTYKM